MAVNVKGEGSATNTVALFKPETDKSKVDHMIRYLFYLVWEQQARGLKPYILCAYTSMSKSSGMSSRRWRAVLAAPMPPPTIATFTALAQPNTASSRRRNRRIVVKLFSVYTIFEMDA